MDLAQFKALIRVAEPGSLSKAADRMNIAQPADPAAGEEAWSLLFRARRKGMVLTEAGRKVLEHASRIMSELDAIRSRLPYWIGTIRSRRRN